MKKILRIYDVLWQGLITLILAALAADRLYRAPAKAVTWVIVVVAVGWLIMFIRTVISWYRHRSDQSSRNSEDQGDGPDLKP